MPGIVVQNPCGCSDCRRGCCSGIGRGLLKGVGARFRSAACDGDIEKVKGFLQLGANVNATEGLLPWLYLKGLSTGDFSSALTALLGQNAAGLSAATISRLKEVWAGNQFFPVI
jgi:hypothetical protein